MRTWLAVAAVLLTACGSKPEQTAAQPKVRITQFYSPKPAIPKGEKGMLCYGVENAKSVKLDPPEVELTPSFTRCVEIAPKQATTYTLVAEGADGATEKQSVDVKLGGARVQIKEISVNSVNVRAGALVRVCVTAPGAAGFEGSPGTIMAGRPPARGCLEDRPRQTTTYRVAIAGPGGEQDEGEVTVQVK